MSGDEFNAVSDEKLARALVEQRKAQAKEEEFKLFQKLHLILSLILFQRER